LLTVRVGAAESNAEFIIRRKLVTAKHLGPRKAVLEHAVDATRLDSLTKRPARPDWTIEADGGEQRAQEHLHEIITTKG